MSTQSTLTLVDALAEEARSLGLHDSSDALRAQTAFVRALLDELGRYHPSDRQLASLHEQLGEELDRLVELAPASESGEAQTAARVPVDVLIVDDDPPALRGTSIIVRECGHPCRTARNGAEALRECERQRPAIVLSDWQMPGMNGLDLCRALKQRDPYLYVILVTGHDDVRLVNGVREGVDDFLPKPVDVEDLIRRLDAAARLVHSVRVVAKVKDALHAQSQRPGAS